MSHAVISIDRPVCLINVGLHVQGLFGETSEQITLVYAGVLYFRCSFG